mgnify:CR=1 FL=1
MNIYDLNKIIEGNIINIYKKTYDNVQTDTRKVDSNSLLFIFKLEHDNAYKYIKNMKVKPSIIVINQDEEIIDGVSCITVENTILSYAKLARCNNRCLYTIMITGSVGKTITKDLIYDILSKCYKVKKTEQSKNNILGISETMLSLKDEDILVIEAGSNHIGEIDQIARILKPNIGVITKIGTSHIGNFGNLKNIFIEKTNYSKNILTFVNGKDKYLKKLKGKNIIFVNYKNVKIKENITFKINNITYEFNSLNKDLISDVALAINIGLLFDIPINIIKNTIKNFKFPLHRQNIYRFKNTILIDDSYNCSYESLIASINLIKKINKKKLLILGDIYELGKKEKKIHKKIIKKVKKYELYTVGNKYKYKNNFKTKEELYKKLETINFDNKVILVKASRKMEFEKVVTFIIKLLEKDS